MRRQAGFTLVELLIASTVASVVMLGMSSVVWLGYQAYSTWESRIEANGEIRNFQLAFYDDVAMDDQYIDPTSGATCASGNCTLGQLAVSGCTSQSAHCNSVSLTGCRWSASTSKFARKSVTYALNSTNVTRSVAGSVGSNRVANYVAPQGFNVWVSPVQGLSAALTGNTAYTSLSVNPTTAAIASGTTLTLYYGGATQLVTTSSAVSTGATSIPINSFTTQAAGWPAASVLVSPNTALIVDLIITATAQTHTFTQSEQLYFYPRPTVNSGWPSGTTSPC